MSSSVGSHVAGKGRAPPPPSVHQLIMSGDVIRAQQLVQNDQKLVKSKDESGRLPIHWTASMGHAELTELLLSLGSPVDPTDDSDLTPLVIAAAAGRTPIVRLLISKGADVNAQNNGKHFALQYACSKNHFDIVEILLANHADLNMRDEMNSTSLHRAASLGHTKIVNFLLQRSDPKVEIDAKDSQGNTPLHLACEDDQIDVAKVLLAHGAKWNVENKAKKTPIDLLKTKDTATMLRNIADNRHAS